LPAAVSGAAHPTRFEYTWLAVSGSLDMRRCPDPMPFEGIGMLVLAD
jgi:hypothetical protein